MDDYGVFKNLRLIMPGGKLEEALHPMRLSMGGIMVIPCRMHRQNRLCSLLYQRLKHIRHRFDLVPTMRKCEVR